MNVKNLTIALLALATTAASAACGASGPVASGPGPLPNRTGPLSNNLGNQHFSDEAYAKALEAYQRAREELPKRPEPRYNSGNTQYRQRNFDEAQGQYEQALARAEVDLAQRSVFNIGNALYLTSQLYQAVESYREALRMEPDDLDAKYNLELALLRLAQQTGEQDLDPEALGPDPNDTQQGGGGEAPSNQQDDPSQGQGEDSSDLDPGDQAFDESLLDPGSVLTEDQARQLLDAVGDGTETLRSRLHEVLAVPGPPPERDW